MWGARAYMWVAYAYMWGAQNLYVGSYEKIIFIIVVIRLFQRRWSFVADC